MWKKGQSLKEPQVFICQDLKATWTKRNWNFYCRWVLAALKHKLSILRKDKWLLHSIDWYINYWPNISIYFKEQMKREKNRCSFTPMLNSHRPYCVRVVATVDHFLSRKPPYSLYTIFIKKINAHMF